MRKVVSIFTDAVDMESVEKCQVPPTHAEYNTSTLNSKMAPDGKASANRPSTRESHNFQVHWNARGSGSLNDVDPAISLIK